MSLWVRSNAVRHQWADRAGRIQIPELGFKVQIGWLFSVNRTICGRCLVMASAKYHFMEDDADGVDLNV